MSSTTPSVAKNEVRARIEEIGIIPAIRAASADDALFAARAVHQGGIPIAEITMTVPGALDVISELTRNTPGMIVGAGTVLDAETGRRCIDAGANFLTSTGFDLGVVELAVGENILVLPGALTPTEVMAASKAKADIIKIYPLAHHGGEHYFHSLKIAFPDLALVAAGGVNQQTAAGYIHAGAAAIGIGRELIPREAIHLRKLDWILELTRRFIGMVQHARSQRTIH